MTIDISAATEFMTSQARLLDRRRFELRLGDPDPAGVLAALNGYRNPDGGYGWGLESDLRTPRSQPAAGAHAFEVFADLAPRTVPEAVGLCDWLETVTLADGGVPMALPLGTEAGSGPWWAAADPAASSLQITAFTAAFAWQVAAHDPAVANHPWLERATRYCLGAIAALDEAPFAYALAFSVNFLDAVHDQHPEAPELLAKLGAYIPADGRVPVQSGIEGESLHPLSFAPYPDRPSRQLFTAETIAADLDRLAGLQQPDGGWIVDFESVSPAASLEWRGYATLRAVDVLNRNLERT